MKNDAQSSGVGLGHVFKRKTAGSMFSQLWLLRGLSDVYFEFIINF